jgi:bifunctional DNA-binding transcriptional regulator/antitoxin component of YhaV-PrlF toxin-antitoxin module
MKASVVVDEVGRLVLPKEIRESIGVFGRTSVNLEVIDKEVRISALEADVAPLKRRGKRIVYDGALPENWNSGEAVLKARERRIRR